ncbi:FtsH protease regulator HflC [compost metagenome]
MIKQITYGVIGLVVVVVLSALLGSFYTVDQGERAVQLRNGKVTAVADPGLHFKMPFIDDAKFISTQTKTFRYDNLAAYSRDQQPAKIRVSVTMHVPGGEVANVYEDFTDIDTMVSRIVNTQVPTQTENVFGKYNAIEAVQKRDIFQKDLTAALVENIKGPVVIDSVQLENIDFDDSYEDSVRLRMQAEVAVETARQTLKKETVNAQIAVTKAQAIADSRLAQATAEAAATRLMGDAAADAIKARAAALSSNQNLVELTKAERWNGILPTTMLPNSTVPFLTK